MLTTRTSGAALLAAAALSTVSFAGPPPGDPCDDPGAGCCNQPNGTPGCFSVSDPGCCDLTCANDPFCCEVEWELTCAVFAQDNCAIDSSADGCIPVNCAPDAGACCAANGTPGCDDPDCCSTICDCDPFCCDQLWDAVCAGTGLDGTCGAAVLCADLCADSFDCGAPGAGDCCEANGTPGCDDAPCCNAVCLADPFCCDTAWDALCAGQATDLCTGCAPAKCDLAVTPGATPEPEPCGDDANGGCNASPASFGTIGCGETIRGTSWATGGLRDTDWYLAPIPDEDTIVTAELDSELPTVVSIVDGIAGCSPVMIGSAGSAEACVAGDAAQASLTAGLEVAIFVSTGLPDGSGIFAGFPCDSGLNDYEITLTCGKESGPVNDDCDDAVAISDGDTAFSNIGATTDGPILPAECDSFGNFEIGSDIWYAYMPACSGTLTVSTCSQADFDTRLAAYTGSCDALAFLGCNDDGPGCAGFTSMLEVPVTCGTPVLLRVGAFGDPGAQGTGTLSLSCAGTPCEGACPGDTDGSGQVDVTDLTSVVLDWGPCPGCPADLDGDGVVGVLDLTEVILNWGPCP